MIFTGINNIMITIGVTGLVITALLWAAWDRFASGKIKGRLGEYLLDSELKRLSKKNNDGHTFKDIYILKDDGNTTQIDNIFVSRYGLFVFETKHYKGKIFGASDDVHWTHRTSHDFTNRRGKIYTKFYKNKMYNPIRQNRNHIKWLAKVIEYDPKKMANFVCFTGSANINEISYIKNVHTIKTFRKLYNKLVNSNIKTISDDDLLNIKDKIDYFKITNKHINKIHNEYVKEVTQSIKTNKYKNNKRR